MEYNIFVAEQRTTAQERRTLDTLRGILEERCGFPFVRTGPKTREFALQRQMLAYTASRNDVRITHIAAYLGYRSHQTVLHSIKLVEGLASYDPQVAKLARDTDDELEYRTALGLLATKKD